MRAAKQKHEERLKAKQEKMKTETNKTQSMVEQIEKVDEKQFDIEEEIKK